MGKYFSFEFKKRSIQISFSWPWQIKPLIGSKVEHFSNPILSDRIIKSHRQKIIWFFGLLIIFNKKLPSKFFIHDTDNLLLKIKIEYEYHLERYSQVDLGKFSKYISDKYDEDLDDIYHLVRSVMMKGTQIT